MPAEWEPHDATWLAWPHNHDDWPEKFEPIPWVYAEIIRNLARHERVELIVNDAAAERKIRKLLDRANARLKNIRFHRWRTDRVWLRDSGCIFSVAQPGVRFDLTQGGLARPSRRELASAADPDGVSQLRPLRYWEGREFTRANKGRKATTALAEGDICALNFDFNAWAKYSNWHKDKRIGSLMADAASSQPVHPMHKGVGVVLEGGSIDVNGCGTLLTTEECLLSKIQQRNPGMLRADYERIFAKYLGAENIIWLGKGIAGDDTHGHVDDLARFVAPDTIVTVVESNPKDANYTPLRENLRRLKTARDQSGRLLNIVEIPMPRSVIFDGRRLPASYANFYIANGIVLVPVFDDPNDRIAMNILCEIFPNREIVPIYSGDLVWGLGTMHCMTQQQPSSVLRLARERDQKSGLVS
jgi:agmatine deiminase